MKGCWIPFPIRRPGPGATLGRAFLFPPLTGSDRQTGCFHFGNNHRSLPGLGPRWSVRKPDKKAAIVAGAVGIGLAAPKFPAGYFPYCASPAGGRQHGAGGPCFFTAPAKIVGATGAANQTSPRFKLLRAASIGEAAFLFPSAPAPRGEQAKAADSLPKRDRKAAHRAVPVTTKEVTGIDSRA